MPESTVVAGPVRVASAISWTGRSRSSEVLGQPAHHLGEDEADDDGAEAPSSPRRRRRVVADVDERDERGADDGEDRRR